MLQAQPFMLLTGASRGIGHAAVKLFQERGWRILTVSRQPFSEECRWPTARESHLQADLADLERLDELAAEVRRRLPDGALHALVGFLGALTNADADGRIILDPTAATAKFVLLNAAAHFRKVCLGIILSGLQPPSN